MPLNEVGCFLVALFSVFVYVTSYIMHPFFSNRHGPCDEGQDSAQPTVRLEGAYWLKADTTKAED
jgi:hypothetical protein